MLEALDIFRSTHSFSAPSAAICKRRAGSNWPNAPMPRPTSMGKSIRKPGTSPTFTRSPRFAGVWPCRPAQSRHGRAGSARTGAVRFPRSTVHSAPFDRALRQARRPSSCARRGRSPARQHAASRRARQRVRGGCLAAKQDWDEAIRFLQAAYEDGCRDILCLRWLTTSLVAGGRRAEAVEIVHEWQTIEPDSEALRTYRHALEVEGPQRQAAAA